MWYSILTRFRLVIAASIILLLGSASLAVVPVSFMQDQATILQLETKDFLYDPHRRVIYATIPSNASTYKNTLAVINPATGVISTTRAVGANPNALALSDDGRYLYIGLDGTSTIKRFQLPDWSSDLEFTLNTTDEYARRAIQIKIMPGRPRSVVVIRRMGDYAGSDEIVVYDDGVPRAQTIRGTDVEFVSPTQIYVLEAESSFPDFYQVTVTENGLENQTRIWGMTVYPTTDIVVENGLLYTNIGEVIDPSARALEATYHLPLNWLGAIYPDASIGRNFVVGADFHLFDRQHTIRVYSQQNHTLLGELSVRGAAYGPLELLRWGADGLAFRTLTHVVLVRLSAVNQMPTPTLTPTSWETPIGSSGDLVRRHRLPTNDLLYDALRSKLYASLPARLGSIGNSIAELDPMTGIIIRSVYVGSEPNVLALSDDNQYLYVALEGAGRVARVFLPSFTLESVFRATNSEYGVPRARFMSLAVAPGAPHTLVVSFDNFYGPMVFDNGQPRPYFDMTNRGCGHLDFGGDINHLYGIGGALCVMRLAEDGARIVEARGEMQLGSDAQFDGGMLFTSSGRIYNPTQRAFVGALPSHGLIQSDIGRQRIFMLSGRDSHYQALTYHYPSLTLLNTLNLNNVQGVPRRLVQWSENSLVFNTDKDEIFYIRLNTATQPLTPTPTPPPNQVTLADGTLLKRIDLVTSDLIYDKWRSVIYASLPSHAGMIGNSIAILNPTTGVINATIPIGSEPTRLALSDDGHYLYAILNGEAAVRRINLETHQPDMRFTLGERYGYGPYYGNDIAVQPGAPDTVVVARREHYETFHPWDVTIFDSGRERKRTSYASEHGSHFIEFLDDSTRVYGASSNTVYIIEYGVEYDGLLPQNTLIAGYSDDLVGDDGRLYTTRGIIIDPNPLAIAGRYGFIGPVRPDSSVGRTFILTNEPNLSAYRLVSFEQRTLNEIGSTEINSISGTPSSLLRWGVNGLAFRTDAGQVFLLQSPLVGPPLPTRTPTPFASPTPLVADIRRLPVMVSDIAYDHSRQGIWAGIVSASAIVTNSVTFLNPDTGAFGPSLPFGDRPGRIALSDDARYLYVAAYGTNIVKRFYLPTLTQDLEFSLGEDFGRPYIAFDMLVQQGRPNVLIVIRRELGTYLPITSVYNNGGLLPLQDYFGYNLAYGPTPSELYTVLSHKLVQLGISAAGITKINETSMFQNQFGSSVQYANGRIYTSDGDIYDAVTRMSLGGFEIDSGIQSLLDILAVDPETERTFFLKTLENDLYIRYLHRFIAFDQVSRSLMGEFNIPRVPGKAVKLIRWGHNGLAYITDEGALVLLRTSFVGTPRQTRTPTPSPSPTVTQRYFLYGPYIAREIKSGER